MKNYKRNSSLTTLKNLSIVSLLTIASYASELNLMIVTNYRLT